MRATPKRITLYTTPTCPWCMVAKRYLAERSVDFSEVDLREMVLMTAQHGVPVLRVGEKAMVGWNPEEFERLFGA
jgi:glutaredoxin 3